MNAITYRIESADHWDGVTSVWVRQGGYHFHTEALAKKLAARIDASEACGMTVAIACGLPPVQPQAEDFVAHVWAWEESQGFNDIPF